MEQEREIISPDEKYIVVRVVLGNGHPTPSRLVLEFLPDGTCAVGKEISERTQMGGRKE